MSKLLELEPEKSDAPSLAQDSATPRPKCLFCPSPAAPGCEDCGDQMCRELAAAWDAPQAELERTLPEDLRVEIPGEP